jgi:hypothetical protein
MWEADGGVMSVRCDDGEVPSASSLLACFFRDASNHCNS